MKANRKTIAIIIATLVLVAAATTGIVMYLNDDGTSRAGFDENEPSISDVNTNPGPTEENNQGENDGNTENPANNNEPGNLPEAGENENQGKTANRGGTTGANTNQGTITTTSNANVPNQEYVTERVEEVERQITEDLLVGWTPLSITSAYSTNGIGIYKPDLEIVKVASTTDGNNSVTAGDALTYAMAVKNNGNEDITGLTISDVIPEQTTFIEGTIYGDGTYNKELNKIVWKVDVKAGEVVAVGFAVTVNENATGAIKNVGTIDGKNTEEVVNPVITSEKLAEVYRDKQPIEGPANIGDQIKYTIVAKNTGDVDATVVMKDTIPANTELVSPIEVAGEEIDEATMNVGKNVTVPAGETVELTFTVEIKAIEGSIKNIATVGTTIPDTETKTANLEMTKTVSDKINGEYSKNVTLKVGETAYFKIELNNTGSEDLEVTMTDIMNDTDIQLYDGDKAIAQTVTVPAGTTKTLTATYKMQQEDIDNQQRLKNTATATTPVTPGNEDTAEVTPEKAEPGIKVEKTTVSVTSNGITTDVVNGKAPMVRAGDVITYTITVTNTGNTTLKDIKVIDTTLDVNYDNTTIKAGTPIDTISSLAPKDHKTYTVTYTVTQDDIETKTQIENAATATGSEEVPSTPVLVNPNVTVSGEKTWNDYNEQEQKRPVSITVKVMNGDKEVETIEVKPDANGNWKYTSKALPKYDENNNVIKYAVIEEAVEGYTPSYAEVKGIGTANITANITNTLNRVPTVTVSGTKHWEDEEDQDGIRPDNITIAVISSDKTDKTERLQTIGKKDDVTYNWTYRFTGLPKYDANNQEIQYSVTETGIDEKYYTSTPATVRKENGNFIADITNKHTPATISLIATKHWEDASNQDGFRPTTIKIKVMEVTDEQNIKVKEETFTGTGNDWTYEFKELPKYKNGNQINYTIVEEITTNKYKASNPTITVDPTTGNITAEITNTHIPETVNISGTKTWVNDNEAQRPESITVNLLEDGTTVNSTEVTENKDGKWVYEFKDLPKYKNGTEIKYTVKEDAVARYETTYSGYDIINTLKPLDLTTKKITSTKGGTVAPGEEITYTISIKNNSNEATGTFNVKDSVPVGTTLKTEENPAYTLSVENNVTWLTWNVSLKANASTTVSFTVIVDMTLNDGDKIKNKAIVDEKDTNEVIDTVKNIVRTVNVKEHGNSISKTNIVIVLDLSSSMTENKSNRLANAKTAAKEFIDSIYTSKAVSGVNIEVITFNTRDAIEKKNVESEECTRSKNPDHYDKVGGFFGYYDYEHKSSGTSCEQHGNRWYTKYVEKTEIVPYSGTKVLEIEGVAGNVAKNYDGAQKIKNAIEAIEIPDDYKEGGFGTHMYAALQLANTEIGKLKDAYKNNDNAVVFLGDGKPYRSNNYPEYADNTDANIKSEASKIRGKATLYAIRYAEDVALLKDINNGGIASEGSSFASTNLNELKNNFQAIKNKAQDREIKINSDNGYITTINPTGLIVSDKKPVRIRKNGTVIATYTSLEDLNNSGLITYDATTKEIKWNVRGYAKTDKLEIEYYVN